MVRLPVHSQATAAVAPDIALAVVDQTATNENAG